MDTRSSITDEPSRTANKPKRLSLKDVDAIANAIADTKYRAAWAKAGKRALRKWWRENPY